ncbi:MAG: PAS domain S-box protein, partial [Bacillota bacterium]
LRLASVAEAGLINENIKSLEASPIDLTKRVYIDTKNILSEIVAAHKNIRFAYIFMERDGRIYFAVDNEPADSKDYSPPGQEYTEATPQLFQAFIDGKPVIEKSTDRWGAWVSVLIPMKEETTGKVIALFGVDYTVPMWYEMPVRHTVAAATMAFCIILVYLCLLTVIRTSLNLAKEKRKLSVTNEKLQKEQELFRTIFEQSPVGISVNTGGIITYNTMYEKIVGRTSEEMNEIGWKGITHPDDLKLELKSYNQFNKDKLNTYTMNKRYIKPDGSIVWANITVARIWVSSNSNHNYVCIIEDITERIKAEKDLLESERSHAMLLSNLPGMAYRCNYDHQWTMQFVSEGCLELTGYSSSSLINNRDLSYNDLINPKYHNYLWEKWIAVISERKKLSEEYEIITASGESKWVFEQGQPIYDELGNVEALEGLIVDISDRKRKEEEILYLNNHDYLTGIYNRRYLEMEKDRLNQENLLPLSVIIGDINGVKMVNDAFGHAEGDILIIETAKIMQACCRDMDIVARTGGDEFMMLMPFSDEKAAGKMLDKIKSACEIYNKNLSNEAFS